jgi:hypothetical protein
MLTLIANSGIQFHTFDIVVDSNESLINRRLGFYEYLNQDLEQTLEYAYYFPDEDTWIRKGDLVEEGYLKDNKIAPVINFNTLLPLSAEECYRVNDILGCFEAYENIWLPIPYFTQEGIGNMSFGPTAWARVLIKKIKKEDTKTSYRITLAFDTAITTDIDNFFMPTYQIIENDQNSFLLCPSEDLVLNFLSTNFEGQWITSYLEEQSVREGRAQAPGFKYAAQYLTLIRYLSATNDFPEVNIYSDQNVEPINVDLVLDIGNANTCGLLFESPDSGESFKFDKVQKLNLTKLNNPAISFDKPFDMRLVFSKANFGNIQIPQHQKAFQWPSFVRIGEEAKELISTSSNLSKKQTHHSSPKRYLWDEESPSVSWDFIEGDSVYIEGLSELFDENGNLLQDHENNLGNLLPFYTKKSLLTFVYIEIFLHALSQINSFEFRNKHLERNRPRRLKRVIISCPTAIIQEEQVALRQAAQDAAIALNKLFDNYFSHNDSAFEVVPSVKDLSRDLTELEDRSDWIYDEATCCQLVFLYSEISKRYLNNSKVFFDLFGKRRNDIGDAENKALTIGTVDIGGGTTDLMICSYQNQGESDVLLKPTPLYWESFSLAGDDFLKELIQHIVLEGIPKHEYQQGCTGVIENYAKRTGCSNVVQKMNDFFGTNPSIRMDGDHKSIYRKNFIVQIAKPIAERYLEHACSESEDIVIGFDELFPNIKPNKILLEHFNDYFSDNGSVDFKFENIKWKLSTTRVFEILESTFDLLFKQLSILISSYGCDFLLLAGQITKLSKIQQLFLKFYSVSADRIISLNNYRIGRWYPYADSIGRFEEPKTIVSVGALIAMMSGKYDLLEGFRINPINLKTKLISTVNYLGALNRETHDMQEVFLSPKNNRTKITVSSLPLKIGYKQLNNTNYPGKPIYQVKFDYDQIREFIIQRQGNLSDKELKDQIDRQEKGLKNRMPFEMSISRTFIESKELIEIEEILDVNKDEVPKKWLKMSYMTLPEPKGYWLDTGEFSLNINLSSNL